MQPVYKAYVTYVLNDDGHIIVNFTNNIRPQFSFKDRQINCPHCGNDTFLRDLESETINCKKCKAPLSELDIAPYDCRPLPWDLYRFIELFYPEKDTDNISPQELEILKDEWHQYHCDIEEFEKKYQSP